MFPNERAYSQYQKARITAKWKVFYVWLQSIVIFLWNFIVTAAISLFMLFVMGMTFIAVLIQDISTGKFNLPEFYYVIPAFMIIYGIPLIPYFVLGRKLWKTYKKSLDLSHLEELPLKISELIKGRIDILSERMPEPYQKRLANFQIKFFYEKRNFTALPSMVFSENTINIIIPLGYLKTIKSDSEAADAILAHELAHFFHNDSNLLLKIRCYYQINYLWKKFIPFLLLGSLTNGLALSVILSSITKEIFDVGYLILYPIIFIFELLFRRFLYKNLLQKVYDRVLDAEMLADLFAVTITSAESLKRFLKTNIDNPRSWNALYSSPLDSKVINIYHDIWNSLHPILSVRVANIDNFYQLINKRTH